MFVNEYKDKWEAHPTIFVFKFYTRVPRAMPQPLMVLYNKIRDTVTGGSVLASGAQPPASVTNLFPVVFGVKCYCYNGIHKKE